MSGNGTPVKTASGREEIEKRSRRLPSALRSVLLLVDGRRSHAELQALCARLHAPDDALAQLAAAGLVAFDDGAAQVVANTGGHTGTDAAAAERYRILYALTTDLVREQLGVRGYFLQLKLERATGADDIVALLQDLRAALAKRFDLDFAEFSVRRVQAAAGIAAA